MNSDPTWFYENNGERIGPVPGGEILNLYRSGGLRPDTLVWREGLENWIPFSASELASVGPPPIPAGPILTPPPVPARLESFVPRTAALRPGFRPQIRSSFDRGWALMISNFWPIVGCFTLTYLILSVASQFFIPVFFLMYPLMGGLYWYLLRQVRGQEANMEMIFEGFRRQFGPLAIVNLIVVGISMAVVMVLVVMVIVLVAAGMAIATDGQAMAGNMENPAAVFAAFGGIFVVSFILFIPLMILSQVGNFATILILDCGLQAKEAMSLAWTAVRPFLFKMFLFMLVNTLLAMAGMIALFVGMFITGAWASLALVYLYEDAFGDEPSAPKSVV